MAATRKSKSAARYEVSVDAINGGTTTVHTVFDTHEQKPVFVTLWAKKAQKRAAYLNGETVAEATEKVPA